MPHWLLQSLAANPDLADGQPPPGILATLEREELAHFTSLQRRCDWLLGRWTAKRLLQQIVQEQCAFEPPADSIIITTAADGAPTTSFRAPCSGAHYSLSLSHSHGYALCAVVEGNDTPIGVDLEAIEPRDEHFTTAFFNEDEQRLLPQHMRDLHITAIWSAKEATLKAVRIGLRADPRQVSCLLQPVAAPPQDWIPFQIRWRDKRPSESGFQELKGWWHVLGDLVLALATTAG